MTAGALQTASLTLNPPNLGPLQVVLNVTHDQATASFFAAQPEVRQRFADLGTEPVVQGAEAFRKTIAAETKVLSALIRERNLVVD